MQLDKFTDYGLRVLIHLKTSAPDKVSVSEIATRFNLSANHLSKVCTALASEGFVISERGRAGGLKLGKPPEEIAIGAVVRSLTKNTAVAECFAQGQCNCVILPACGLRDPLREAQEAFFAVLDGYSLADVTRRGDLLAALLSKSPAEGSGSRIPAA